MQMGAIILLAKNDGGGFDVIGRACVRLSGPQLVRVMQVADIWPEKAEPAPFS